MARRLVQRRTRSTSAQVADRIQRAMDDPALLAIGVVDAMHKYNLNYEGIITARRQVMQTKLQNGQTEELMALGRQKDLAKLRNRVLRAETKFPRVHRRMIQEGNMSDIARDLGVSRERIRQLKKQFNDLLNSVSITEGNLLDEVESECVSR